MITSPWLSLTVFKISTAIFRLDARQRLSIRVTAFFPHNIAKIFGHSENIFHNSCRVFEYIIVYTLQNIGKFIPMFCRHINSIGFVNMSLSKRFYITALRSKSKSIKRILQVAAGNTFNLSSGRKHHFSCFNLTFCINLTVGFYHTSQSNMSSFADIGIMIYHCPTVHKNSMLHNRMSIHHCPLHNKTSCSNDSAWAYNRRRMDNSRHLIASFQKFFCPI